MSVPVSAATRGFSPVVALVTAKRGARSGALWGVLFGLLVLNETLGYHHNFPTPAARAGAVTAGASRALTAVIGPGRGLDTAGGWIEWRTFGLLSIVGAIWGLLAATRLLRGEEDAGRWELYLAGRITRRAATGQALLGLAVGFLALWLLTVAATAGGASRAGLGLPVLGSLLYATAVTASAAMFLTIGALCAQLGGTRRHATILAAALFGLCYVVRMVADAGTGLAWLRWASPLGWVENVRPYTDPQPLALLPVLALIAGGAAVALALAGRRDAGTGLLSRAGTQAENLRFLGGPVVLGMRLERWVMLAWAAGLALLAMIFGVTAATVGSTEGGSGTLEQAVNRLGGQAAGPRAWIGYEFVFIGTLVAFAAVTQIAALRTEEADGRLDHLLAGPVSRRRWLAGRLTLAAAFALATGIAAGLGGWIGLITGTRAVPITDMLQAGINAAVPGLLIIGLGGLLYALAPRIAVPAAYALILWSFLLEIIGSSITGNHWLLDTAVLGHLGPVPATGLNASAVGALLALGAVAGLIGLATVSVRDLLCA